ncbi:MAG: DUF4265 domain-containing protein [Acidimicrobiia bacterium]|nr:DUF4265 domain-containing protein [Acidimicrobiia bacterium]
MINHVSGTDPWSLVFELMDQCKLALMAPGAATCVPTEEVGGHLPDELVGWIVVRSGTELLEAVTTDPATAIHEDPAWQDRANYILRVDLEPHGMPGRFEQLWARQLGQDRFELCCIPFFIYGAALGDVVATGETPGGFEVIEHSGRRCIRVAFENGPIDDALHETFHAALVGARVAVEFHQPGYAAIDIPTEADIGRVVDAIRPFTESNGAVWEFADQWGSSG